MINFAYMNAVKTSAIRRINEHAQQQLYTSVRWKNLCKSINVTMNTLNIDLWL